MVVEYFLGHIEQVKQLWITDGVVHVQAIFPSCEDVSIAEDGQLLRKAALFDIQTRAKIIHAHFAVAKLVQDSDTQRVRKRLEKFGFELAERLADALLRREEAIITPRDYYEYTHFSDVLMTDQEVLELPKVWAVGGDGGMGDIGYQNTSKVILQNRPNVNALMLDTQVYSNTGGQNSDSTPMLGGSDMNVYGAATQGKTIEKKTVAETFLAGHGSPFVEQVSTANPPKLYRAILDGLEYRGTAFLQCFTTCQPSTV